jgi:hypothetical protein
VTVAAPNLDAIESCYTHFLNYRVAGRGRLGSDLASLWGCDEHVAESRCLLLAPERGDKCVFRFVESEVDPDYVPFATHGWNAAEIMVQNVDQMAERLADSPFRIVGEPANLSFTDDIRAMQILGPANELLYLTEFKKQLPGFDTPVARCAVDLVFIVILGGPSMSGLQDFYAKHFGVPEVPTLQSRVKGMSAAFGTSPDDKYAIAAMPLAGKSLIEADEMPPQAKPRPVAEGRLPSGIAMVSFAGHGIDDRNAIEIRRDEPPYRGHARVSCWRGAGGELLEVLHTS